MTRADTLVVLLLGAFSVAVAAPLASKPRERARRIVCRTHLGKIGKAMLVYAGEYDGVLPRAGGPTSEWGAVVWDAVNYYDAYGVSVDGSGGRASISSCFYLLVKYIEMPPALFVCPSDRGATPFSLTDEDIYIPGFELSDLWEFGSTPPAKCSYAYHIPFTGYGLTTSRDPNLAVAADRNPWIVSPIGPPGDFSAFLPDLPPYAGTASTARNGNSVLHQSDGQNVLFLDGRVTFQRRAYGGIDDDNIYTRSTVPDRGDPVGIQPAPFSADQPANAVDSLLLHDPGPLNGPPRRR